MEGVTIVGSSLNADGVINIEGVHAGSGSDRAEGGVGVDDSEGDRIVVEGGSEGSIAVHGDETRSVGVTVIPLYEVAVGSGESSDGERVARSIGVGAGSGVSGTHGGVGSGQGDVVGGDRRNDNAVDGYTVTVVVGVVECDLSGAGDGRNGECDIGPVGNTGVELGKGVPSSVIVVAIENGEFVLVASPLRIDIDKAEGSIVVASEVEDRREEHVFARAGSVGKGRETVESGVSTRGTGSIEVPFGAVGLPAVDGG